MFKGIVYCHTNRINGKKYIGQTTRTLKERIGNDGKGYSYYIGQAIKKYGWENFETEILEEIESEDLNELHLKLDEREIYWIVFYDTTNTGYNITEGGNSSLAWTDSMREKLSKTNKGHPVSDETKRKISEANKGRKRPPVSEETRKKLSEANKRRKTFGSRKGQKTSEETKKKLSEAHKGKKMSKESMEKRTKTRRDKYNGNYNSNEGLISLKKKLSKKK